jgi:hypothetical protein
MIVWLASLGASDAGSTLLTLAGGAESWLEGGGTICEGLVGLEPPQPAANSPNNRIDSPPAKRTRMRLTIGELLGGARQKRGISCNSAAAS